MKPWLLNILACPICKSHPVTAHFFTWETDEKGLKAALDKAGKAEEAYANEYGLLAKQLLDGTISLPAIDAINDKSENKATRSLLTKTKSTLKKLVAAKKKSKEEVTKAYKKDLDVVNRYFNLIEVDKGLLVCKKCERWYPIGRAVEGVPEMLPDDLREDKELEFLEKWKSKVPKETLTRGKPFNLTAKSAS